MTILSNNKKSSSAGPGSGSVVVAPQNQPQTTTPSTATSPPASTTTPDTLLLASNQANLASSSNSSSSSSPASAQVTGLLVIPADNLINVATPGVSLLSPVAVVAPASSPTSPASNLASSQLLALPPNLAQGSASSSAKRVNNLLNSSSSSSVSSSTGSSSKSSKHDSSSILVNANEECSTQSSVASAVSLLGLNGNEIPLENESPPLVVELTIKDSEPVAGSSSALENSSAEISDVKSFEAPTTTSNKSSASASMFAKTKLNRIKSKNNKRKMKNEHVSALTSLQPPNQRTKIVTPVNPQHAQQQSLHRLQHQTVININSSQPRQQPVLGNAKLTNLKKFA